MNSHGIKHHFARTLSAINIMVSTKRMRLGHSYNVILGPLFTSQTCLSHPTCIFTRLDPQYSPVAPGKPADTQDIM